MALFFAFLIVSLAFCLGVAYSLFANKNKSREVRVFECGIKKSPETEKKCGVFKLDSLPMVVFLIFDAILLFILYFCSHGKTFSSEVLINLLIVTLTPTLGFIYLLKR